MWSAVLPPGAPVPGGDEEVGGADGGVADIQRENGLLGGSALFPREALLDDGIERGVEETFDGGRGRGIAGGGFAPGAGGLRDG